MEQNHPGPLINCLYADVWNKQIFQISIYLVSIYLLTSVYLSIYLSTCLPACQPDYLSVGLCFSLRSIYLPIYLTYLTPTCLPVSLSAYSSIQQSIPPTISLHIPTPFPLSTYLSTHPSFNHCIHPSLPSSLDIDIFLLSNSITIARFLQQQHQLSTTFFLHIISSDIYRQYSSVIRPNYPMTSINI